MADTLPHSKVVQTEYSSSVDCALLLVYQLLPVVLKLWYHRLPSTAQERSIEDPRELAHRAHELTRRHPATRLQFERASTIPNVHLHFPRCHAVQPSFGRGSPALGIIALVDKGSKGHSSFERAQLQLTSTYRPRTLTAQTYKGNVQHCVIRHSRSLIFCIEDSLYPELRWLGLATQSNSRADIAKSHQSPIPAFSRRDYPYLVPGAKSTRFLQRKRSTHPLHHRILTFIKKHQRYRSLPRHYSSSHPKWKPLISLLTGAHRRSNLTPEHPP